MATAAHITPAADISTAAATHSEWLAFFLPEGRACVARRQELGDYISNPERCARLYANFAAFDALVKGEAFRRLDFERARNIAGIMAGLPTGIEPRHQTHTVSLTLAEG